MRKLKSILYIDYAFQQLFGRKVIAEQVFATVIRLGNGKEFAMYNN